MSNRFLVILLDLLKRIFNLIQALSHIPDQLLSLIQLHLY